MARKKSCSTPEIADSVETLEAKMKAMRSTESIRNL